MNLQPHDDFADVMLLEEFISCCNCGALIPYDGDGYYATQGQCSDINVWSDSPIPTWATHVAWYNR